MQKRRHRYGRKSRTRTLRSDSPSGDSIMAEENTIEATGVVCNTCPRHCSLSEGEVGNCNARICKDGKVISLNYGRAVSLALDPIEKKPLYLFFPGSKVLSVGSRGCNMHCMFCQNHTISQITESQAETDNVSPQ